MVSYLFSAMICSAFKFISSNLEEKLFKYDFLSILILLSFELVFISLNFSNNVAHKSLF